MFSCGVQPRVSISKWRLSGPPAVCSEDRGGCALPHPWVCGPRPLGTLQSWLSHSSSSRRPLPPCYTYHLPAAATRYVSFLSQSRVELIWGGTDLGCQRSSSSPPRQIHPSPPMGSVSSELKATGPLASLIPGRPWCLGLGPSSQLATGLPVPQVFSGW